MNVSRTNMPTTLWIGSNSQEWILRWFTKEEEALAWASEAQPHRRFIAPFKISGPITEVTSETTTKYTRVEVEP